ncbi:hypothetical protein [Rhizobium sp. GCM10022189]|uniref:hypothetical protein n=1 Tax=Rhizobium sp. GCM10022189 TaxID=3252654 RepID=UPI00360705C6
MDADKILGDSVADGLIKVSGARAELERLLSDPRLRCTDPQRRFLRFVSEELFRGRHAELTPHAIAVRIFNRTPSFDPATDPIVRIEAARLRMSLSRFYELHGRSHEIQIDLPSGSYFPRFTKVAVE